MPAALNFSVLLSHLTQSGVPDARYRFGDGGSPLCWVASVPGTS